MTEQERLLRVYIRTAAQARDTPPDDCLALPNVCSVCSLYASALPPLLCQTKSSDSQCVGCAFDNIDDILKTMTSEQHDELAQPRTIFYA